MMARMITDACHCERHLTDRQRHAAGGDGNKRRAEHAGAAVIGPEAGVHRHELCGVLRYVAHKRIDAISAPELRAVRHISMSLQRAQERHHIRLVPPSNRTRSTSPC